MPLRPAWTIRSISELLTAPGVAVHYTGVIRDAMGWEGVRLQDALASPTRPRSTVRFLRHERALRDMMAARLTLGGGPA